jgi:hypothetical protein
VVAHFRALTADAMLLRQGSAGPQCPHCHHEMRQTAAYLLLCKLAQPITAEGSGRSPVPWRAK